MRISDWSSDVCSSDLPCAERKGSASRHRKRRACRNDQRAIAWKTCAAPDDRAVVDAGEGILRVEIGRASCRERVCPYGSISVVAGSSKKKKIQIHERTSNINTPQTINANKSTV